MKHKFPALTFFFVLCLAATSWAQSAFQNIVVGNLGHPNEPSIIIDPADTNKMMVATNTDKIFYSDDGGKTWFHSQATSQWGVFGDPCLLADSSGNFFYFHLAKNDNITVWPKYADRIVCERSNTGGDGWQVDSYTGNNVGHMQDKEWAAIDTKNNAIYVAWTQFDEYDSSRAQDSSTIYFSKSTDGGANWSNASLLSAIAGDCLDSDSTIEGAMPAIGINGEVYVTWAYAENIYFNKSLNGGTTWSPNEKIIADQPEGWDYPIFGLNRCNGLPVIACDVSTGPYRGTVYINWTDKRNGPQDADVYIAKSIDGGATWGLPVRVNDDPPGKENFSSWMAIDQSNGDVYVVFYDRRNYSNDSTDVYLARSTDGGNSFVNYRISESAYVPDPTVFNGDYNNISAVNGCVRPVWTRQDTGQTSVLTAIINFPQTNLSVGNKVAAAFKWRLLSNNPTKGNCLIAIEEVSGDCSLQIVDVSGRLLYTRGNIKRGDFVKLNLTELGAASGIYFIKCMDDTDVRTFKILVQN